MTPGTIHGPRRVNAQTGAWPLHTAQASRAIEAAALAAHAPHLLMQRAGLALARLAQALVPHAEQLQVFAGPGNNGGDGIVAATHLHRARRSVRVCLLADAARIPPDAAHALAQAQAAGVPIAQELPHADAPCDLIIDALLGLGTSRAPQGLLAEAIERCNLASAPVLAVDLPSGLNADTGQPLGRAVHADATLALLTLKPGLFTGAGRDHAGVVWLDTLGVDSAANGATARLPAARAALAAWPQRSHARHKGSFGDVVVVGGAPGMTGAAMLAAQAALAAGAGRVYCSLLDELAPAHFAHRPELMHRPAWWLSPPPLLGQHTVVCGCGGGELVRAALPPLLAHAARLVLDADALNAIASEVALQQSLARRAARGLATVLTPHPLEAARLLGTDARSVQGDRLQAAQELARRFACTVLLKGSGSVLAAPGVLPSLNTTGNALLASAGTGDVLAGWIGGTWSALAGSRQQERLSQPAAQPALLATLASAWLHGSAADQALARGQTLPLRAADLIEAMRAVLGS